MRRFLGSKTCQPNRLGSVQASLFFLFVVPPARQVLHLARPEMNEMWRQFRAWLRRTRQPTEGGGFELCNADPPSPDRLSHQSSDSELATQPPSYSSCQQDDRGGTPPCHGLLI